MVFRQSVNEVKSSHPEVLSFCMFGSMVKGTVRPESDIDGYLFVDVEKFAEAKQTNQDALVFTVINGCLNTYLTPVAENVYLVPLRETLMDKLSLKLEQVEHVGALPVSRQIIDQQVSNLIQQVRAYNSYWERLAQWQQDDPTTTSKPIEEILEHYKRRPMLPGAPLVGVLARSMFHLAVGKGIEQYRSYFINELIKQGKEGKQVWSLIVQSLERVESNMEDNTGKYYPKNLEAAKKVYGNPT